jgi:N-acetylglutamate synthase-like GNAT family acetyltransferase
MVFSKNDVVVRKMLDEDIKPVVSVWWAEIPGNEEVAAQIKGNYNMSVIAEHEVTLVGLLLASLIRVSLPITKVCLLHDIAVKPDYRQHGIGAMLINKLWDDCQLRGIKTMRALVPVDNLTLKAYVEEWGFRPSTTIN